MSEVINVVVVKDDTVNSVKSFVRNNPQDSDTVRKAEDEFVASIEYLFSKKLTDAEQNDVLSEGHYGGYSEKFDHTYSINLIWSF